MRLIGSNAVAVVKATQPRPAIALSGVRVVTTSRFSKSASRLVGGGVAQRAAISLLKTINVPDKTVSASNEKPKTEITWG